MEDNKKFITYVSSKVPKEDTLRISAKLCEELPLVFDCVDSVQEIFPLLSNPHYKIDAIVIDVDDLYNQNGLDSFDIIRTLYTLINCTVYRPPNPVPLYSKPQKRTTKIIALIPDNISKNILKELLSMNEISSLTLRYGGRVDYTMIKKCVEHQMIKGSERFPKFISDFIKEDKPQKPLASTILLTARQRQIFDIVTTRGLSNKHIAKMLSISESTVKLHVGAILKKYGLKSRTQLAVFAKKKKTPAEAYM